ncbi:MAG TPA: GtrA family protein [Dehalococcoidia bacterium]|nr:GtrA family protein [Dehalococcoidia bacterium]
MSQAEAGAFKGAGLFSLPVARFAVVGVAGFVVDGALLTALVNLAHVDTLLARGVSFPMAVTLTWFLNRRWTFFSQRHIDEAIASQYLRYVGVQISGAGLNVAVFLALLVLFPGLSREPLLALAPAALGAAAYNYVLSRQFAFRYGAALSRPSQLG